MCQIPVFFLYRSCRFYGFHMVKMQHNNVELWKLKITTYCSHSQHYHDVNNFVFATGLKSRLHRYPRLTSFIIFYSSTFSISLILSFSRIPDPFRPSVVCLLFISPANIRHFLFIFTQYINDSAPFSPSFVFINWRLWMASIIHLSCLLSATLCIYFRSVRNHINYYYRVIVFFCKA